MLLLLALLPIAGLAFLIDETNDDDESAKPVDKDVVAGEDFDGADAAENIEGTDEDDVILANGGNDTVFAGEGDDLVEGGAGDDRIFLEGGNDVIGVTSFLDDAGDDLIRGGDGDDLLIDNIGSNTVYGELGSDGIDVLDYEEDGELAEEASPDFAHGGYGEDTIWADNGDTVTTGAQADLVEVVRTTENAEDVVRITDFNPEEDTLELTWVGEDRDETMVDLVEADEGVLVSYDGIDMALLEGVNLTEMPSDFYVVLDTVTA